VKRNVACYRLRPSAHWAWSESRARCQTGSANIAKTLKVNSQPATSYSIQIQSMGLSATVSKLVTTSGFGGTGSTNIYRRPTSKMVLYQSTSDCWPISANFRRKTASDSHFHPNRKWKYGGNQAKFMFIFYFLNWHFNASSTMPRTIFMLVRSAWVYRPLTWHVFVFSDLFQQR